MITGLRPLARRAQKKGYAIPAFNVSNLEMAQAVIRAAVAEKSPVIVQTSEGALSYAGDTALYQIIKTTAETLGRSIPVVIHLDHGKHPQIVKRCLALGYTSVHMDASAENFKRNIALTHQAVVNARKTKSAVQGELGAILGKEGLLQLKKGFDYTSLMTDPKQAKEFVAKTGIDTLAVSVGTIHGSFKGTEHIDVARIRQIAKEVSVPLVLHGGSGNDPKALRQAIKAGICIINVDTDLRIALLAGLRQALNNKSLAKHIDPRAIFTASYAPMQAKAQAVMRLFGSSHQA